MTDILLCFHQGWSDIINSLALINYYVAKDYNVQMLAREDAKGLVEYYTRDLPVKVHYCHKKTFDSRAGIVQVLKHLPKIELKVHGYYDSLRTDNYSNSFRKMLGTVYFVKCFYEAYDIDYMVRIKFFDLNRDLELEEKCYQEFTEKYGTDYILHHNIFKKDEKERNGLPLINIAGSTDKFFDYIKILLNAKELHLLDSVWAAIVYILDCKYSLFKDKIVNVYCRRKHNPMFLQPVKLDNWNLV